MPTPVSLALRTPFDAAGLAGFLAARAVPGVESVDDRTYRRGALALTLHDDHVVLDTSRRRPSDTEVAGARRLLDLDADPEPIGAALAADPALAALVAAAPGLRVPGAWDGFEVAVRAVVGQQVTVAAARTLLGRLVTRCEVAGRFPTPAELLAADLDAMGMPGSRVATLRAVAAATLAGDVVLDGDAPAADVVAALRAVRGVGPWTASYIALRALRDPDAFPIGDAGLRAAARRLGLPVDDAALLERAERWRPWRAYATVHLWRSLTDHPTSVTPTDRAGPDSPGPARRRSPTA